MTVSDLLIEAFGEDADLYSIVLKCPVDANSSQLRKAYHKRALEFHPDKQKPGLSAAELELATKRFQAVSAAYEILKDEDKRKAYDESGELDDDGMLSGNDDSYKQWTDFFRAMFKKVTIDEIDQFGEKYRGSDEEAADVLKYYDICKGDLNKMVTCVMLSEENDKQRWMNDIIEPAIANGKVERFAALSKTLGDDDLSDIADSVDDENDENSKNSNKKSKAKKKPGKGAKVKQMSKKDKLDYRAAKKQKEEREAEHLIAAIRGKKTGALTNREAAFGDLLANLENKYANGGKKDKKGSKGKSRSLMDDNIPDDEFERIQARLLANKGKR